MTSVNREPAASGMRAATGEPDVGIDIIVPTRNRAEDLRRMVPTMLRQSYRKFRLVIVDQSDDPRANAEVIREAGDARVTHLVHGERGKSRALNFALKQTSAPTVAFTDDDCTPPEDWLAQMQSSLERNPTAGVLFGSVLPIPHDPSRDFIPAIEIREFKLVRGPLARSPGVSYMGANMVIRRSVFEKIGLFDEDLGPGGLLFTGEDCEIAYRALKHRIDVALDPSLTVVHYGARPISGGLARALVNTAFFAIGAGYGKHMRAGDLRTFSVVGHETTVVVRHIAGAVVRRQRPLHLRRLGMLWKGIVAGVRRGPRVPRY